MRLPAVLADSDISIVELAMKLHSEVDGLVTGVRFYKGPQNVGTHWATCGAAVDSYWLSQPSTTNEFWQAAAHLCNTGCD